MLIFKEALVVGFHMQGWYTTAFMSSMYYSSIYLKGHWLWPLHLKYLNVITTCMTDRAWDTGGETASTCPYQTALTAHTSAVSTDSTDTCAMSTLQIILKVSAIGAQEFSCQRPLESGMCTGNINTLYWGSLFLIVSNTSHALDCSSVSVLFLGAWGSNRHY